MTKLSLFSVILTGALLLGACTSTTAPTTQEEASERPTTTLTGKVVQTGTKFSLVNDSKTTEVTSMKIKLEKYVGQTIEATGEFSGTTLYVDEVK